MKLLLLCAFLAFCLSQIAWGNYFPNGFVNEYECEWFSKHLSAMEEPVLDPEKNPKDYFAFRILYLPTWGRPVAVRYEKNGEMVEYRAVMLSGDGGYEPGEIKKEKKETLSSKAADELISELWECGFWALTIHEEGFITGTDGSELVLQAVYKGKQIVRSRWTPEIQTEKRGLEKIVDFYTKKFVEAGFWNTTK